MLDPIDIGAIFPSEILDGLSDSQVEKLVRDLASLARAKWIGLAGKHLHSSFSDYVAGIQGVVISGEGRATIARISLEGVWPNMVENGFSAYDMRDTLLGPTVPVVDATGQKGKRQSESGEFYRSIPFRIGSRSARGTGVKSAGDIYAKLLGEAEGKKAGRRAMARARKLKATTVGGGYGERIKPGEITEERLAGHHKSDIFAGMYRFEEQYKEATQSTYGTFRTISTAQPDGWQHPGMEPGKGLAKKVADYLGIQGPKLAIARIRF